MDPEFVRWWNNNCAGRFKSLLNILDLTHNAYLLGKIVGKLEQIEKDKKIYDTKR